MSGDWFTVTELAALELPGLPTAPNNLRAYLKRIGALDWQEGKGWRKRAGSGGGVEFHACVLPTEAQAALRMKEAMVQPAAKRAAAKQSVARDGQWDWYERLPEKKKRVAMLRASALDSVTQMVRDGTDKTAAMAVVARRADVSRSTLYGWEAAVLGVPRGDWLPLLAPRHAGGQQRRDCDGEAWDMLRADWLRPERPTFESCFRRG